MHIRVDWLHNFVDEPVTIYSEIDNDRNEIRKIELFIDGKFGYASNSIEFGGSGLSKYPLPELYVIAEDKQFLPCKISKVEFDRVWAEKVNI